MRRFDAIVLAGGRARRMAGRDKPGEAVGGRPLVERVAAAAREAERLIVAGPPRAGLPGATVVREDPPGAGPVPALAAALPEVHAPWVALLAGDLPFLTPADLHTLDQALHPTDGPRTPTGGPRASTEGPRAPTGGPRASTEGPRAPTEGPRAPTDGPRVRIGGAGEPTGGPRVPTDRPGEPTGGARVPTGGAGGAIGERAGAVLVDAEGREQWLIGLWRTERLRSALEAYEGSSLRGLLTPLDPVRVALGEALDRPDPWLDCDTTDDLAAARAAARPRTSG